MGENRNSYRQILKATSLFGGVQIFSIIISIAKSKIAALLIGVSGIGVIGVLSSTLNLILGLTRFGLDFSAVKEIASANNDLEKDKVSKIVNVTRRLTWLTGVIGAVITIVISPWLSLLAFGNKTFTFSFIIISMAVFFNQLTVGNMAILQGFKSLKKLAKAMVLTSFFSLITASVLYYLIGEKGIPWVIALTAIGGFLFSKHFASQINVEKVFMPFKRVIIEGNNMLKLGFVLSLGTLASLITTYIIQIFITNVGSVNEVGLYNAGFVLINSYVVIFFNALSKDFFPRLSAVSSDEKLVNKTVNQQTLITVLLLTPLIILFLVFKSVIVTILYTKEFLPILGMITFGIVGTIFKAISWSMGFIIIAKGDSKLYLKIEVISNILLLIFIVLGYKLRGLTGIGISYLVYYIIYSIIIKIVVSKKYRFYFDLNISKMLCISIFLCSIMLYLIHIENIFFKIVLIAIVVLLSMIFTIVKLNRYIGLIDLFNEMLKNKTKKED